MVAQSARDLCGARVLGGADGSKGMGKVIQPLVHPTEPRIVGLLVSRPDLLLMVKRADRFVALDACRFAGTGIVVPAGKEDWDEKAYDRLGVDPGACRVYFGQRVQTREGQALGTVSDILFDWDSGAIEEVQTSQGTLSDKVKGRVSIPRDLLLGYASDGTILVAAEALEIQRDGGVAAEVAAKAGVAAGKAAAGAKTAGAMAGAAIEQGSKAVGKRIGRQVAEPDARLGMDDQVVHVVGQNLIHFHRAEHNAARNRHTAAYEAGSRASHCNGDVFLEA